MTADEPQLRVAAAVRPRGSTPAAPGASRWTAISSVGPAARDVPRAIPLRAGLSRSRSKGFARRRLHTLAAPGRPSAPRSSRHLGRRDVPGLAAQHDLADREALLVRALRPQLEGAHGHDEDRQREDLGERDAELAAVVDDVAALHPELVRAPGARAERRAGLLEERDVIVSSGISGMPRASAWIPGPGGSSSAERRSASSRISRAKRAGSGWRRPNSPWRSGLSPGCMSPTTAR